MQKNIKRNKNWRVIIYSKPGVGKTSSIKYLKGKTLVLDLDNSSKVLEGLDVDVIQFDRSKPEEELIEFLKKSARNYKSL